MSGLIQKLNLREESQVANALKKMMLNRAIDDSREEKIKFNFSTCPLANECICARDQKLFSNVCDGEYSSCPGYNSMASGKNNIEEVSKQYEKLMDK